MSAIKKQFIWKFGYPRFQKKLKLNFEKEEGVLEKPGEEFAWNEADSCSSLVVTAASENVCWDFGGNTDIVVNKGTLPEAQNVGAREPVRESELDSERIYCNLVELSQDTVYENQRTEDVEDRHIYENTNSEEPLYENCTVSVNEDDKEHIYEQVSCQSPVNIFLGLLQSETETISPDPHIYEVPPGAIFNTGLVNTEEPDTRNVKPPEGFQDYENVCCDPETGALEEEPFSLPFEVIYSTVVKPKRKKSRPHISSMLHEEKNKSFKTAKGTGIEMSGVTDIDSRNVVGFSGTENAKKCHEDVNCKTSSELTLSPKQECNNYTSSEGNIIDLKIDGNVVCPEENSDNNENVTSCGDNSHSTEIDSYITSCEDSINVDKYVDPYADESINMYDDNSLASSGDVTTSTKVNSNLATCENNSDNAKFGKCVAFPGDNLIDNEDDKYSTSCRDTVKSTEGNNCMNCCEDSVIDSRVDIFTTFCESHSNGINAQDTAATHEDDSNNICIASCKGNAISTNIDKILSPCEGSENHTENNTSAIICGDNGISEIRISSSNEISDSSNDELPNSTVRNNENTENDSDTKISDISKCDCRNVECAVDEEASVIEISEDGTWETKTVPPAELGQAKQEDQINSAEEPEFLCAVDRSAETVRMTYGSQYYVNCPIASVKPMKHDGASGVEDETSRNIGAQIMKRYEEERQKLRDNLPDVSLLDVEASLEDIQRERRRIIDNQTVRAKRIDSWIRSGEHPAELPDDLLELEDMSSVEDKALEVPSSTIEDFVSADNPGDSVNKFSVLPVDSEISTNIFSTKLPAEGEVVYDSIIQNKHKTKSYWEQLMMAAATSEQPRVPFKRDLLSLGSDGDDGKPSSDVSEQEYYDARSQISLHSPAEPLDSLDQTYDLVSSGPKIVETVAKKLMEAETVKLNKSVGEESVIEVEIRLQREREEALAREREEARLRAAAPAPADATTTVVPPAQVVETCSSSPSVSTTSPTVASPNATETKIALELQEMREREEELRRLRQRLNKEEADDGFNSIPNTDEGNFSEYGSEEKELSLDGNNSRMMSPEVPASPGAFLHQRTQSMDSMSSGHSSGSGSGTGNADVIMGRRRVTVKPLDEPDDDEIPTYMRGRRNVSSTTETSIVQRDEVRNQKETPIEREIRLTREREEELRREKRLPPVNSLTSPAAGKQEVRRINSRNTLSNDCRSVQHRIATSRIQQEINEATEREKELREAGTIQTMSEDTVDSKVTRFTDLAEFAIEEQDRKLLKSVSTSHIPQSVDEINGQASPSITSVQKIQNNSSPGGHSTVGRTISQSPSTLTLSPRKFPASLGQKGLMQRFLATRGKMGTLSSGFVTASKSPTPVPLPVSPVTANKLADTSLEEQQNSQDNEKENGDVQRTMSRRGYISAGEKIQVELQEMQKREEELRLQRARMFARSQPNLLCLGDGDDEEEQNLTTDRDVENHTPLRSAVSNPNLLDSETTLNGDSESSLDKSSFRNIRKRSALIAQWENMIQQNIEH